MGHTEEAARARGAFAKASVVACARWLLAIPAAFAPRRYWPALEEHLPLGQALIVAAVATVVAGVVVGFEGFLDYAQRANEAVAQAVIQADRSDITERDLMGIGATAFIAFVFFSAQGWLALYLCFTGAARCAGALTDSPFGDPLLTFLDWAPRHLSHERRSKRLRREREEAEGPQMPDLVVAPTSLRMQGCDLVVVASRRKPGWQQGAFVVDGERTFRLGTPVDRHYPAGLRTLYPLARVDSIEALRRWVRYELPESSSAEALFVPRAARAAIAEAAPDAPPASGPVESGAPTPPACVPKNAVALALPLLQDTNNWARVYAVDALKKAGDPRAVEPLKTLLQTEKDPMTRKAVEEALRTLAEKQPPKK